MSPSTASHNELVEDMDDHRHRHQQCGDGSRERRPLPRRLQRAACGDASCAEMQPSLVGRVLPLCFPATSAVKFTSFCATRHDRAREIDNITCYRATCFIFDLKRSKKSRRCRDVSTPGARQCRDNFFETWRAIFLFKTTLVSGACFNVRNVEAQPMAAPKSSQTKHHG